MAQPAQSRTRVPLWKLLSAIESTKPATQTPPPTISHLSCCRRSPVETRYRSKSRTTHAPAMAASVTSPSPPRALRKPGVAPARSAPDESTRIRASVKAERSWTAIAPTKIAATAKYTHNVRRQKRPDTRPSGNKTSGNGNKANETQPVATAAASRDSGNPWWSMR